jgi:hypothetical protein
MIDIRHKPPYPPKPTPRRKPKAMTMAASFHFDEGVLLCADRLITHGRPSSPDSFGSYQEKIWEMTCRGFSLAITGAGTTAALKAIADKTMQTLQQEQGPDEEFCQLPAGMIEAALKEAVDEVHEGFDPQTDSADVLLAVNQYVSGITVTRNTGRIISRVGTSDIVGIGENSLIGFLVNNLYRARMNQTQITAFAALLVHEAKTYCPQYCGGQTDIKILKRGFRGVLTVPASTVGVFEIFFHEHAKDHFNNLLHDAIQFVDRSCK